MSGSPQPIRHGTNGGYHAHRRRGEDACDMCKDAHNRYEEGADALRRLRQQEASTPFGKAETVPL